MTDKKFEIKNLLDRKNKKLKFNWIISLVLALFALVILFITIQNSIKKAQSFFDNNVVRFNRVVEIKVNIPFKVISKEEVKREESLDKKAEEISNKCVDDYLLSLTPTPKQKSGIIKPVQAASYTYLNFSNTSNYEIIISKLKNLYVNWQNVAELIGKESSFDIGAINPTSGACGLVQALPCKKMQCSLSDIDCQLNWQKEYISSRYGTAEKALQFWRINNWY